MQSTRPQPENKMVKAGKSKERKESKSADQKQMEGIPARNDALNDTDGLSALKAHFLASFGEDSLPDASINSRPRAATDRKGKKKAVEVEHADEIAAESGGDEIDRLMAGGAAGEGKGKGKQASVAAASQGKTKRSPASSAPSRPKPQTIVFDGGGSSRGTHGDDLDAKKSWRAFMNTRTANTEPEAMTSATEWIRERTAKKRAAAEAKASAGQDSDEDSSTEAEQTTNDRELSHLLNTTLFSNGANTKKNNNSTKPDLSSHSTLTRLLDLSSSNAARKGQVFGRGHGEKALRASQLSKMPSNMRQGIREAAGDRAAKEVEKNRELGLLNSKYSRRVMGQQVADATMTGKKQKSTERERGLGMGVGRFKNGTLHLSKDEVRRTLGEHGGGAGKGRHGGKGKGGGAGKSGGGKGPNKRVRRD